MRGFWVVGIMLFGYHQNQRIAEIVKNLGFYKCLFSYECALSHG